MASLEDLHQAVIRAYSSTAQPLDQQLAICYHAWWVPRKGSSGSLYPVNTPNTNPWPTSLTDLQSSQQPILTDRAVSASNPNPSALGNGNGHPYNNHLKSINLLFGDGHVEQHKGADIQMRYYGNYYNFY
jgi:prepilin-type processing-associated H-X9-DG protein